MALHRGNRAQREPLHSSTHHSEWSIFGTAIPDGNRKKMKQCWVDVTNGTCGRKLTTSPSLPLSLVLPLRIGLQDGIKISSFSSTCIPLLHSLRSKESEGKWTQLENKELTGSETTWRVHRVQPALPGNQKR